MSVGVASYVVHFLKGNCHSGDTRERRILPNRSSLFFLFKSWVSPVSRLRAVGASVRWVNVRFVAQGIEVQIDDYLSGISCMLSNVAGDDAQGWDCVL